MQWPTANSVSEMYRTLKEIFVYYRIDKTIFETPSLSELELTRLEFIRKTQAQISSEANSWAKAEIEKLKLKKISELNSEQAELDLKIIEERNNYYSQVEKITTIYEESQNKIERQVVKNGLVNSSILIDKITMLEDSKNKELALANEKYNALITAYNSRKGAIEQELSGLDEFYNVLRENLINTRINELNSEQDELEREAFKYNNGLDEKEQRYRNSKIQSEATLDLKYKELRAAELSKDELVELGYYEDVIKCVTGYFDQYDAEDGFNLFKNESKLIMYLDDYYQELLYLYQTRLETVEY